MAELPDDLTEQLRGAVRAGQREFEGQPSHPKGSKPREDYIIERLSPLLAARVRAEAVADERQRITTLLVDGDLRPVKIAVADPGAILPRIDGEPVPSWCARAVRQVLLDQLAAASVPVATPEPPCTCEDDGGCIDYYDEGRPGDCAYCQDPRFGVNDTVVCPAIMRESGPVATPTEPPSDELLDKWAAAVTLPGEYAAQLVDEVRRLRAAAASPVPAEPARKRLSGWFDVTEVPAGQPPPPEGWPS